MSTGLPTTRRTGSGNFWNGLSVDGLGKLSARQARGAVGHDQGYPFGWRCVYKHEYTMAKSLKSFKKSYIIIIIYYRLPLTLS